MTRAAAVVAVAAEAAAAAVEEMVFVSYTAFGAPLREGVRGGESRLLGSLHGHGGVVDKVVNVA